MDHAQTIASKNLSKHVENVSDFVNEKKKLRSLSTARQIEYAGRQRIVANSVNILEILAHVIEFKQARGLH